METGNTTYIRSGKEDAGIKNVGLYALTFYISMRYHVGSVDHMLSNLSFAIAQ